MLLSSVHLTSKVIIWSGVTNLSKNASSLIRDNDLESKGIEYKDLDKYLYQLDIEIGNRAIGY